MSADIDRHDHERDDRHPRHQRDERHGRDERGGGRRVGRRWVAAGVGVLGAVAAT